jgi:intracellular multiplication protein IcmP
MAPAPAQGQQQGSGGGDNSLAAFWLTIFFFALIGVIWYVFRVQIAWLILKLKFYEIALVSIFASKAIPITQYLQNIQGTAAEMKVLGTVLTDVGNYFRYPVVAFLMIFAFVIFLTHPTMKFKRAHNMKTLYEQEKYNWPQIMPISSFNLVKEPIEKGPWGMSLTPMQFAKKHKLIVEEREKKVGLGQSHSITVNLARAQAYQVFSMQLDANFYSIDKVKPHIKALFAIFSARVNKDEPVAKKILDQLAVSYVSGHLDFSGIDEAVKKYKELPSIKKVLESHAYVITMMASMLEAARQDGVVASADFLWLKLVDRPMWYMLNGVGRQTAFVEVGGAVAHWLAEKRIKRKISTPMVEEAVKALDIALKEVMYVPELREEEGEQ